MQQQTSLNIRQRHDIVTEILCATETLNVPVVVVVENTAQVIHYDHTMSTRECSTIH